jgi:hypothetical protein
LLVDSLYLSGHYNSKPFIRPLPLLFHYSSCHRLCSPFIVAAIWWKW